MSTVVDNRVVSMEFDNSKFEKNVEESLGTLKKLSNSLDTLGEGSAAGLEKLMGAIGNISFDRLADGVDTIIDKFSLFGQIGTKMVEAVAEAVVNLALKFKDTVDSLTIDQVAEGWTKYALKTTSVQTIMNATGKSIDEVSDQLDKLMWFTDETSYDFADMANSIGKFTSNGQDLDKSVIAMEGISNWAALSGQGAQQASIAMYNLSQALSAGAVKAADWRSIELANMATQEFKESVLEAAVEVGTLQKSSEGVYKTIAKDGKEAEEITASTFRSMLDTGFFTSEVLMTTLQKYGNFTEALNKSCEETGLSATDLLAATNDLVDGTKTAKDIYEDYADELDGMGITAERLEEILNDLGSEEYELGRKAFAAGQEAKTFADALNAVKDAASSAWLRVFENIFGNYEEAKSLWTTLANDLYDIFVVDIDTLNDAIEGASTDAWSTLTDAIEEAGGSVSDFESSISEMAKEAGVDIDGLIAKYGSLNAALRSTEFGSWLNNNKNFINKALDALGLNDTVTKQVSNNASKVEKTWQELHDVVLRDCWGWYGTGDERDATIRAMGFDPDVIAKYGQQWYESNPWNEHGRMVFGEEYLADAVLGMEEFSEVTEETAHSWENLQDLIDSTDFSKVNFRQMIALGITSSLEGVINSLDTFRNAWNEFFNTGLNEDEITEKRANSLRKFSTVFAAVATKFKNFTEETTDTNSVISRAIQGVLAIGSAIVSVCSSLLYFVSPVLTVIKWMVSPLIGALAIIGDWAKNLKTAFNGLNPIKSVAKSIADSMNAILSLFGKFGSGIFGRLFQNETTVGERFSETLSNLTTKIVNFTEKFENFKNKLESAKSLKEVYDLIATEVSERVTKIKDSFTGFMSSITKENVEQKISEFKDRVVTSIRNVGKAIIAEWLGVETTDMSVTKYWYEIESAITHPIEHIKSAFEDFNLDSMKETFVSKIRSFGKSVIAQWLGLDTDDIAVTKYWYEFESMITHPIKAITNAISNTDIPSLFESIKEKFKIGWESVKAWFGGINLSSIWNSIKSGLASGIIGIGSAIRSVFGAIKGLVNLAIEDFKEYYNVYSWEDFGNLLKAKIKEVLTSIKDFLVDSLKGIVSTILQAFGKTDVEADSIVETIFGKISEIFTKVSTTLENWGAAETLGGLITSIVDSIANAAGTIGSWFNGLGDKDIFGSIGTFFTNIWTSLSSIDLEGIVNFFISFSKSIKKLISVITSAGAMLALMGVRIAKAFAIAKIGRGFGKLEEGLEYFKKAQGIKLKYEGIAEIISSIGSTLLKIAAAIVIVVAAIWVIGKLSDNEAFKTGLEKFTNLALTIVGIITVVELINFGLSAFAKILGFSYESTFGKLGTTLLSMAGAVIVMIVAIKIISAMHFGFSDSDNVLKVVGALGIAVAALAVLASLTKGAKIGIGSSLAIIGIATAVVIMASAIKKVCEAPFNDNAVVLVAMVAILAMIISFFGDTGNFKVGLKGAFVMLALALDIVAIGEALKRVSDLGDISSTLMSLGKALLLMSVASYIDGKGWTEMLKGSVAIIAMSVAMIAMYEALKLVSGLGNIEGTLVQIGEGLLLMAAATFVIGSAWSVMLIGAGIIVAFAAALAIFGLAVGVAATGMTDIGNACQPFADGLQALTGIDFGTLAGGLAKLAATFITLGLATAVMSATSGTKLSNMTNGLVKFCSHLDKITVGLDKLAVLGEDSDGTVNKVDVAMDNLTTIFRKIKEVTTSSIIKELFTTEDDDALEKVAASLINFNTHIGEIQNLVSILGGSAFENVDSAMEALKSLISGVYSSESEAYGSDFSDFTAMSENLVKFGNNLPSIQTLISSLATYGTEENKKAIQDAIDILGLIIGSEDTAAFSDNSTGLIHVLNSAESTDWDILTKMSDGFASFKKIGPAIDTLKSMQDLNVVDTLQPIVDIFGEDGVVTKIISTDDDFSTLTTMSTALASFVDSFAKIPEIPDTVLTDLIGKSDEFTETGEKLLMAFMEGLDPKAEGSEIETTKLITIILDEFKNHLDDWKSAGSDAAASFVAGITEDSDSIIESINAIVSGVSSSGLSLGEVNIDTSGLTGSGGIISTISSLFSGVSIESLLGGKSLTEFIGLDSLTGAIDITSMFEGLTGENGTFDFKSFLGIDSLTDSIKVEDMFSTLTSSGGDFDFSKYLNVESLTDSIKIEDMFSTATSSGEDFDFSKYLNIESLNDSIKVEDLIAEADPNNTIKLDDYVDSSSLSTSLTSAISVVVEGIADYEPEIAEATDSLMKVAISAIENSVRDWNNAGKFVIEYAIKGIKYGKNNLITAVQNLMTAAVNSIRNTSSSWLSSGLYLALVTARGISSGISYVNASAQSLVTSGAIAINTVQYLWQNSGTYLSLGLARGISAGTTYITTSATNVAQAAIDATNKTLAERSPSRVFMRIGEYISQGMAIGILNDEDTVVSAAETMANSAIATATTAETLISSILESSDNQPTIRPVLDLSEVQQQAQSIGSILGATTLSTGSLASKASSLSTSIDMAKAKIQNAQMTNATVSLDANSLQAILANSNKPIQVNTNIAYEGSLAQLATVLHPYIKAESNRIGPSFVNSSRR